MTIYDFNFKEPFANGADSSEIQPFPDENRGLGIAFVQTDGKPEMKGLNGLFNKITKALLSLRQNGLLGWVNDIEYIQGGFVVEGQKLYQAKVNNTNRKPSESQSDWELWTNASNISVDANENISKDSKLDGSFTLKVNDATTTVKGVARFATPTEVVNKSNVGAFVNPNNTAAIAQSTDLGIGQSWQNVSGVRTIRQTYTNTTTKPIMVQIGFPDSNNRSPLVRVYVGGILIIENQYDSSNNYGSLQLSFVVPSGQSYLVDEVNSGYLPNLWTELR